MKINKSNLKKIIASIIIVASLFLFLPPIQQLLLNIAEIFLGRALRNPEKWINKLNKLGMLGIITSFLISFINLKPRVIISEEINHKTSNKVLIFLFISSAIILLFCSTTSPLYAFHAWDDSHCFLTVGKSVLSGKVIYRDIYEQKGPLLYFIHTFAYIFFRDSFLGIWIIEIFTATFFMYFSFKTISLFTPVSSVFCLPVILAVIFSSTVFVVGDSAEELCLCLLAYPLFASVKNLKNNTNFSATETFIIGLCAGCVFWIKFSLVGFFIGWAIIPIYCYIKNKNYIGILKCTVWIFLGVFAATLPYIIYFGITNSIRDLFQVYIYDNIFLYSNNGNFISRLFFCIKGLIKSYIENPFTIIFLFCSIFGLIRIKITNKIRIHILLCYIFSVFFVFCGGRAYAYYSLIFSPFYIFSILLFFNIDFSNVIKNLLSYRTVKPILSLTISVFFIFWISENPKLLSLKKTDYPQYQFAEIINGKENPTLLNYGFLDGGFYTTTKTLPTCKYFCGLNIPNPKIQEEQNRFIEEALVDFVITRDNELESENYVLLQKISSDIRKSEGTFYLYGKKQP